MRHDHGTPATDAHGLGDLPSSLSGLANPEAAVQEALQSAQGRRWLRQLDDLSPELAERLLEHAGDFRTRRRDRSLRRVVEAVPTSALARHAAAIAAGSAASVLWTRLSSDLGQLVEIAREIVGGNDEEAAENTVYLLTLDPLDPYGLGAERRVSLTRTALRSDAAGIRTLAAEFLFDHDPSTLAGDAERLVRDVDERVRGLAWSAAVRHESAAGFDFALDIVGDEREPVDVRRSALAAIGTHYPTSAVVDLLALFVTHPDRELALDAGNLLYRLHRHPTIATAAASSPHPEVREIGEFLLDPYRGSPAAGGSRPGDPTRSDIFAELIRQTEERALIDQDDEPGQRG